jgi:4-amino-4-deoxy-L-arabinose transferase-like glycosyltransferase
MSHGQCLLLVLALALIPRVLITLRAPAFVTNDSLSYLLPGFDLATGQGFEPIFKRPPAYPLFVGASLWFFGQQSLLGLLLAQHLLGALTVGLAYALATLLFGRPAGLVAGLLTALSGPLVVTEQYIMSETLFGCLLAAAMVTAVLALRRRQLGWLAAAGLLFGLAALTRPVAQILVPGLALLCLLYWLRWRPALLAVGLLVGCYAISVLPWMARNSVVQHSFTLAGGLGEGLAVRTIRLDENQIFDFRESDGGDRLRVERRIYREEARQGSVFELAQRLRSEAGLTSAQADRTMRDIALGAIGQKLLYYVQGSLGMFRDMFVGRPIKLRQDWQPWRGIQWDPRVQHLLPNPTPEQDLELDFVQSLVTYYDPARWSFAIITLFVIGCLAAARQRERWTALLPAIVTLALLCASAFLVGIEWRYRYPLDPLINVMIGGGVVGLLAAVQARPSKQRVVMSET